MKPNQESTTIASGIRFKLTSGEPSRLGGLEAHESINKQVVVGYILPRALAGVFAINIFVGIPAILFGGPLVFGLAATVGCVGLGAWFGHDLKVRKRLALPPFDKEAPRIE